MAKGLHGQILQDWAITCLLKGTNAPASARLLLSAEDARVVSRALGALVGHPVDQALATSLGTFVAHEDYGIRNNALQVIRRAPSGLTGAQTCQLVRDSLETSAKVTHGDHFLLVQDRVDGEFSRSGSLFRKAVAVLATSAVVDVEVLRSATPESNGLPRDCFLMARACRGDRSVKTELLQVVRGSTSHEIRVVGLESLRPLLDNGDRTFLEGMARTDPFGLWFPPSQLTQLETWRRWGISEGKFHPVRETAARILNTLGPAPPGGDEAR
ncbi:MAG: hypothetical protein H7A47_13955 [Verrucomicrobiales bacterium]|nr:hypothetical protein [Verrucomicrobiales bacterium]